MALSRLNWSTIAGHRRGEIFGCSGDGSAICSSEIGRSIAYILGKQFDSLHVAGKRIVIAYLLQAISQYLAIDAHIEFAQITQFLRVGKMRFRRHIFGAEKQPGQERDEDDDEQCKTLPEVSRRHTQQ